MLSWTPKGILVCRGVDNRINEQRQAQGQGKSYLNNGLKSTTENNKIQHTDINLIFAVTAIYDQMFIRRTDQPASSLASLQLVIGLKGSIRLNLTFFIGSYKKARQTGRRRTVAALCQAINWWFGTAEISSQVSHPLPRMKPMLFHASRFSWWPRRHRISCANKAFHLAV